MKICFLINNIYTIGGEQRVCLKIADALAEKNDVTILTRKNGIELSDLPYEHKNNINVDFYSVISTFPVDNLLRFLMHTPIGKYIRKSRYLFERCYINKSVTRKLYKKLEGEYDVVIALGAINTIHLGNVCKKYKCTFRNIGWEHNSYEAYFETPGIRMYGRKDVFIDYARHMDRIVVLAEDYMLKYKNELGINTDVIYNPTSFSSDAKSSQKTKTFFACGRMEEVKGFEMLIEAFSIFCKANDEWKLKIVGDGSMKKQCIEMAHDFGISNRIDFMGWRNDVHELIVDSDVYLLTSRWEGFPMVVTEAYEVGIPVISFDIPAMKALSKNAEAVLVPCFDIEKYAEAMLQLASNYDLRLKMAGAALMTSKELSIDNIISKWENLFSKLLFENNN